MDLDDDVRIAGLCVVEEAIALAADGHRQRGSPPVLADSEGILMEVGATIWGGSRIAPGSPSSGSVTPPSAPPAPHDVYAPGGQPVAPETGVRLESLLCVRAAEAVTWYIHLDVDVAGPEIVPSALTPAPHSPPRRRAVPVRAMASPPTIPLATLSGMAIRSPQVSDMT